MATGKTARRSDSLDCSGWFIQSGCVYSEVSPDTDPDSTRIAFMDRNEVATSPVERDDNAAFIVKACNAHDELLEACKALHNVIHNICSNNPKAIREQAMARAEDK